MRRKIVTICGSMRFWNQIQLLSEQLQLQQEFAVIGITPHVLDRDLTEQEKALFGELHRAKIDVSDAIFVANVGGYIGESTKGEIEYARAHGKEILYLESIR